MEFKHRPGAEKWYALIGVGVVLAVASAAVLWMKHRAQPMQPAVKPVQIIKYHIEVKNNQQTIFSSDVETGAGQISGFDDAKTNGFHPIELLKKDAINRLDSVATGMKLRIKGDLLDATHIKVDASIQSVMVPGFNSLEYNKEVILRAPRILRLNAHIVQETALGKPVEIGFDEDAFLIKITPSLKVTPPAQAAAPTPPKN